MFPVSEWALKNVLSFLCALFNFRIEKKRRKKKYKHKKSRSSKVIERAQKTLMMVRFLLTSSWIYKNNNIKTENHIKKNMVNDLTKKREKTRVRSQKWIKVMKSASNYLLVEKCCATKNQILNSVQRDAIFRRTCHFFCSVSVVSLSLCLFRSLVFVNFWCEWQFFWPMNELCHHFKVVALHNHTKCKTPKFSHWNRDKKAK